MPIIKSAIKKMRKDKKRTLRNKAIESSLKGLVKNMRRQPSQEQFQKVQSALDKAVKTNLVHANRASRLKGRLSQLIASK